MTRHEYAKERAGYAPCDTPCKPLRSAYTDDPIGTGAYLTALQKWHVYDALI